MKILKLKLIALCVLVALIFAACEQDNIISNDTIKDQLEATESTKKNAVSEAIKQRKSTDFTTFKTFKNARAVAHERPEILQVVSEGTIMDIAPETLEEIKRTVPDAIRMDVSTSKSNVELELVKADIFTDDFKMATIDGQEVDFDMGVHYRGIIKGNNSSLVALSFYDDEMSGFFSNDEGNYIIGKMKGKKSGKNEHIVYLESDLTENYDTECFTDDNMMPYPLDVLEYEGANLQHKTTGFGIRVYVEIDNDIYQQKGGGMAAFVAGVFNQSATLYANEGVNIQLSEMRYWPSSSPYTGGSISTLLTQFQDYYNDDNAFNGHIGHLVSFKTNGSGKAGSIGGYCSENIDDRMCYTGLRSDHNTPDILTYTRSVKVFTHEMGHLLGSRHTHACVWNGNNTAIDGCGSCQEEPNPPASGQTDCSYCTRPAVPSSGGGTIMSYCDHSTSGSFINFSKGFGTQPGNVIRHTADQMLNAVDRWSYTEQLGWTYFYGDGWAYTSAYGTIYMWDGNGDVCNGEGVWFYVYDGACGYGEGWFYDITYGTGWIYPLEVEGWVYCTDGTQGLVINGGSNTETNDNNNNLKSKDNIMSDAPDFDKLNTIIQKKDINKLQIPQ